MGFFDALLGKATSQATNTANAAGNAGLFQTMLGNNQVLTNTATSAGDLASAGADKATAAIQGGYGQAGDALKSYDGSALAALNGGVNSAVQTVQSSNANYAPYAANGQAASGLYADSLGLNGQAGHDAATAAFQTSPGYAFQVDQATDAAARKAASLGMAASGNTLDALLRTGSGLASQEYGNWQDRLNGVSTQGLQAASGIAGVNQAAGGYEYGGGSTGAGLLQQTGTALGTLGMTEGNQLGTLQSGLGNSLASIQSGLGTNMVNNNTGLTGQIANTGNKSATAADAAQSANNGVLSKLIGGGLSDLAGTATGKSLLANFVKL